MVTFWFTKVKLGMNELSDVPERYYPQVLDKLVEAGLYDENGNPIAAL
ncbi:hypothetical protein [Desulfitobacterium hafniense]|nr:hypothetical protein [Desulfitobacterium hafniense]